MTHNLQASIRFTHSLNSAASGMQRYGGLARLLSAAAEIEVKAASGVCAALGQRSVSTNHFRGISTTAASGNVSTAASLEQSLQAADLAHAVAHSSLEGGLAMILSPTQLGVQLWEFAHASTGLPWWAAIPVATVGVRTVLMPLSLRAYAASSYLELLHRAFGLSREVGDAVAAAEAQERRQRAEAACFASDPEKTAATTTSHNRGTYSGKSNSQSNVDGARALGRVELVRHVLAHLRRESKAAPFGWYIANATVQVPVMVSLTLALRRMCDSLWPGLTSEGTLYFTDLTAPPVYVQTLSTPYGTAGAILPLALMLLYSSAVDRSKGGFSPGINMALKLCAVPLYIAALQQPHAVLLYWLTHAATQLGVYQAAALTQASPTASPETAGGNSVDDLLLVLSKSYDKAGNKAAARACLQALAVRQPRLGTVEERLKQL